MNASEQSFISAEILTNFGKNLRQSEIDPARLKDALTTVVAEHADQRAIATLRETGAHYFVVPGDGDGFELRLGHHDLEALNGPGAVAGEFVTLGVVMPDDIKILPQG